MFYRSRVSPRWWPSDMGIEHISRMLLSLVGYMSASSWAFFAWNSSSVRTP